MSARRAILLLCLPASVATAQSAFVSVVRGDTVQIEKFTRTPTRLDADLAAKGGIRQVFSNRISADGRLGTLTMAAFAPGARADAAPMARGEISIEGDSAMASISVGGQPAAMQRMLSSAIAQPIVNSSIAAFEAMIVVAKRGGADESIASIFLASGGQTIPVRFTGLKTDSVTATVGPTTMWFVTDSTGRVMRAGVPAQGATISRVDGIAVSKIGFAKPDYAAPTGAPYSAETVTVPTTFGHSLGGTFTKPSGATGPLPVVISITGSGAQDRDEYISIVPMGYRLFRQVADTLGRRGIAMLRMDDRGYGASGGSFAAATSRDFANDIMAAIAYLRTRPDVNPKKIFLLGHSEGGLVAPMVAIDEPSLAGIVLMAGPGRTGREILLFQVGYPIRNDTTLSVAKRDSMLARVPATVDSVLKTTPWLSFFGSHDPIATAKRVKVPVLILQGGDDQQVIASEAPLLEAAFRAGGNRDVTSRVFPSLNHLFILQPGGNPSGYSTLPTNLAAAEVLGMAVDWIALKAARK